MTEISPEKYVELQKIGQECLNKMTDDIQDKLGSVDVTLAISLCMSMTAHYISGIPDKRVRLLEMLKFAQGLATMVEYLASDAEPGRKSNITMRPADEDMDS